MYITLHEKGIELNGKTVKVSEKKKDRASLKGLFTHTNYHI